jgi:hypothetical protein
VEGEVKVRSNVLHRTQHYSLRHNLCHQERFSFGAGSAAWACWSRTCSCSICRSLLSICLSFASNCPFRTCTCSFRLAINSLIAANSPDTGLSVDTPSGSSTIHMNPWGVSTWLLGSSPLRTRRRTVCSDTRRSRAASAMVTCISRPQLRLPISIAIWTGAAIMVAKPVSATFDLRISSLQRPPTVQISRRNRG